MHDGPGTEQQPIVVVDDSADLVEVFVAALEAAGFRADGYTDGVEAIERALREPRPSAFIVDYRMEAMSGLEVMESLRRRGFAGPIVCLTAAHPAHIDRDALAALGVQRVLQKPISLETLVEAIDNLGREDFAAA